MKHIFLLLGVLVLQACSQASQVSEVIPEVPAEDASTIVSYSGDVDTTGWKTYRNEDFGFEVQHPSTFVVVESGSDTVTLMRKSETTSDTIVFSKVQSTLQEQVASVAWTASSIRHGALDIKDSSIRSTIASFQRGDAQSWFMRYFLMRGSDSPSYPEYLERNFKEKTSYDLIVADVEAYISDADMQKMIALNPEQGGSDVFMSEPQQILSTFTFIN